jgi:catechol 2,3-dioxygenase-like lactoylglutathione lyase family enzyme
MSIGAAMTEEPIKRQLPFRFSLVRQAKKRISVFLMLAVAGCPLTQAQTERPKVLGISSAQIQVTDYCKAVDFYSAILQRASRDQKNCPPVQQEAKSVATVFSLRSGQLLNLGTFGTPNLHELVNEFGLVTDNAPALLQYLKSKGVDANADGSGSVRVLDPEGHVIVFIDQKRRRKEERSSLPPGEPRRIIHVGFIVSNQAKMEHFYKDILGFRPYWHGGMKDDKTDWLSLQVPDGTDWVEFMLNIPEDADQHLRGVMNHIALGVSDIHQAREQLVKNGAHLTEEPKIGRDGKWQLNLYDPDQTRVELMEFTPVEKPCCSEFTGPHPKP